MNSAPYKQPLWVVGDIHGNFGKMKRLLQDAGLIDESLRWSGGKARLWFIGDFFDRGTDGVSSLALAMKLQDEAASSGGEVHSLIGNHEVNILSATRFPKNEKLVQAWGRNGGMPDEREKLTPDMIDWMLYLPLVAQVEDYLLIHADAGFYPLFGSTRDVVNSNFSAAIQSKDESAYEYIVDVFSEHKAFFKGQDSGVARAKYLMQLYGGKQIVHGHTPIHHMSEQSPDTVTEPYIYAHDLCINVDGSMYSGGQGFAYQLG